MTSFTDATHADSATEAELSPVIPDARSAEGRSCHVYEPRVSWLTKVFVGGAATRVVARNCL